MPCVTLSGLLAAVSRIPGVDIDLALDRIGGRQSVLESSVEQTIRFIDEKSEKMRLLLDGEDLGGLSILSHGLKAALAGIGATGLSALAFELESASRAGNKTLCETILDPFSEKLSAFVGELRAALPSTASPPRIPGDTALLWQVFRQAADALDMFEADDALGALARLDGFGFGEETDILIEQLKNAIKSYKYNDAARLLACLLRP